jgi:hypothetical protein
VYWLDLTVIVGCVGASKNDLSTQRGIELHADNTDLSVVVQLDGEGLLHIHGAHHGPTAA